MVITVKDFYTMSEAADALGVSEESVRRLIRAGELDSVKPFKRRLIAKTEITRLLTTKATL